MSEGYWLERLTWSWHATFFAFNVLALLFALPAGRPLAQAGGEAGLAFLFPMTFVLLWTAYAANLGQLQGDPRRPWRARYGRRARPHLGQLAGRLGLLLLSGLPLWVVFYAVFQLRPPSALALGYLGLYGLVWGGWGLWLSLKGFDEINQFKLKYAAIVLALGGTPFVARPLSPFLVLGRLLDPDGLGGADAGFLAWAFGAILAALGGLLWLLCRLERAEPVARVVRGP